MRNLPREDVESCLDDEALQRRMRAAASDLDREDMVWVRDRALAEGAPDTAEWIWFTAPEHAWMAEAGTEGWLLYDRESTRRYGYIQRAMS